MVGLAVLTTATSLVAATPAYAGHGKVRTLVVDSGSDSGRPGTLRWAITTSNAAPGSYRILIKPAAGIIKLDALLPPIVGPVTVEGVPAAAGHRPRVGIDGFNFIDVNRPVLGNNSPNDCPSTVPNSQGAYSYGPNVRSVANPGLAVVDSGRVEISNLLVRNFCIGILGLRSHDLHLHDNWVENSVGAAGVIITGDAGDQAGSSTALSYGHVVADNMFLNNGDAAEFTRGTADSLFSGNTFVNNATAPAGVLPSAAVEFASAGDGNKMIGNRVLGRFSDGFQINGGSGGLFERNYITGAAYGITIGAAGNVVRRNVITGNHMGIGPSNSGTTITQNSISGNGAPISLCNAGGICTTNPNYANVSLGIDAGRNGVTPNDSGDTNNVQNFPILSPTGSSWTHRGVRLAGTLSSKPGASYRLEFFASRAANPSGYGEGEVYIGATTVLTDAAGDAPFSFTVKAPNIGHGGLVISATATSAAGATSEFGPALPLQKGR